MELDGIEATPPQTYKRKYPVTIATANIRYDQSDSDLATELTIDQLTPHTMGMICDTEDIVAGEGVKVCVTGATGFIASHLVHLLLVHASLRSIIDPN